MNRDKVSFDFPALPRATILRTPAAPETGQIAMPTITEVAEIVGRRAQRQGYVVPRDIRAELQSAGLPDEQWKEVVTHLKSTLNYRQGRYYHVAAVSPRVHQEREQQRVIGKFVRNLQKEQKAAEKIRERRGQVRVEYPQPVKVQSEDGKEFTLLGRDMSTSGIRMLGTRRLLGTKVKVTLTSKEGPLTLWVRILWTCAVGDDLFENGGNFLETPTES
jgi:hypothetical protein